MVAKYKKQIRLTEQLFGNTEAGMTSYYGISGAVLPRGARPTTTWTTEDTIGVLDNLAPEAGKAHRLIGILSFGTTEPEWTLDGSVRINFSFSDSPNLQQGETLSLVKADGSKLNARIMTFGRWITGVLFSTDGMGDFALIATYDHAEPTAYTVTFMADDTVVETREIAYGETIGSFPAAPEKEGYTFVGWVGVEISGITEETEVTSNMTLYASYEATTYPATVADAVANGLNVHVEVPEGALPSNALFRMYEVDGEGYRSQIENSIGGNVGEIRAVDMSFAVGSGENAKEIQPLKPVTVRVTLSDMDDSNLGVFHINDNGELDTVSYSKEEKRSSETEISFEAEGFSIYAIVENGQFVTPRVKYEFKDRSGNSIGSENTTQIIKNNDMLLEVSAPAPGQNEAFVGWFIYNNDGTWGEEIVFGAAIQVLFGTEAAYYSNSIVVPESIGSTPLTVEIRPKYSSNYATVYFMTDTTSSDTSNPNNVKNSEKVILPDGETSTDYILPQISDDQYSVTPNNPSYTFVGWSYDKPGSQRNYYSENDNRTVLSSPLTLTSNTSYILYPVFKNAWIISFFTAPIGSGADYISPAYVKKGDPASSVEPVDPTWRGYKFLYWTETPTFDAAGNPLFSFTEEDDRPAAFNFSNAVDQNTTLYAYWESGYTTYTVIFWKQEIEDDKNASAEARTYDYAEQEIREAKIGAVVNLTGEDKSKGGTGDYYGFHHRTDVDKDSHDVTVSSSGSSVLNVYYDRDLVIMKFYVGTEAPANGYDDPVFNGTSTAYQEADDGEYGLVGGEYVLLSPKDEVVYTRQYSYTRNDSNSNSQTNYGIVGDEMVRLSRYYSWGSYYWRDDNYDNYDGKRYTRSSSSEEYSGTRYIKNGTGSFSETTNTSGTLYGKFTTSAGDTYYEELTLRSTTKWYYNGTEEEIYTVISVFLWFVRPDADPERL